MKNSSRRDTFFSQDYSKNFTIFDAIDGRDSTKTTFFNKESFRKFYNREPLPGEIGCALSHYELLKSYSENPESSDYAIIVEDDAKFAPNIEEVISNIIDKYPSLDVVLLGYPSSSYGYINLASWDAQMMRHSVFSKKVGKATEGSYRIATYDGQGWGTGAYIISKNSAKKYVSFADRVTNLHWVADHWEYFSKPSGMRMQSIMPPLVGWQGGSEIREQAESNINDQILHSKRKIRERIALKNRILFTPRATAATLRDIADKLSTKGRKIP